MATLREIQLCELEILREIDRVCREHNIPYRLSSGTFLGAVRHKGFIPWDDDSDITMTLEGSLELEKYINKDEFFFQSVETDYETPFLFFKIRKNNTVMKENILENLNIHQGIWVDIFPLVNANNTSIGKNLQYFISIILHSFRCRFINARKEPPKRKWMESIPKTIALKIDRFLIWTVKSLGSKKSNEYFGLSNVSNKRPIEHKSFFDERGEYEFEGYWFWGPKNSNDYLTMLYGEDYLIPKKYGHQVNYENVKC